jgi:MFS family permease
MPIDYFETKFQLLLFTMAQLQGIFLPFFTGTIVDRIGGSTCMIILSLTCWVGQVVSSIGAQEENWPTVITGRFIYGLGFESLFTATEAFLATWYEDRQLGTALGVSSAASYVGGLLSFILSPIAANQMTVAFSFWLATMVKSVAVIAALVLFILCRGTERISTASKRENGQSTMPSEDSDNMRPDSVSNIIEQPEEAEIKNERSKVDESKIEAPSSANKRDQHQKGVEKAEKSTGSQLHFPRRCSAFSLSLWLLCASYLLQYSITRSFVQIASGLLLERNLFVKPPQDCMLQHPDQCSSGELAPSNGNPSTDPNGEMCPVGAKCAPVIPHSLNVTSGNPAWDEQQYVFAFLEASDVDCTDDFWAEACTRNYCEKQETTIQKAGIFVVFSLHRSCIATTFVMGRFWVDRAGLRAEMTAFAPALLTAAHAIIAFQRGSPIVPLLLMGFGYSMAVSALWPSVSLVVPSTVLGTAIGLMTCVQNVGLSCCFHLWLQRSTTIPTNNTYRWLKKIFFLSCSVLAIVVGIALIYSDRRSGGQLRTRSLTVAPGSRHNGSYHSELSLSEFSNREANIDIISSGHGLRIQRLSLYDN